VALDLAVSGDIASGSVVFPSTFQGTHNVHLVRVE
jgi:hypothetical protein